MEKLELGFIPALIRSYIRSLDDTQLRRVVRAPLSAFKRNAWAVYDLDGRVSHACLVGIAEGNLGRSIDEGLVGSARTQLAMAAVSDFDMRIFAMEDLQAYARNELAARTPQIVGIDRQVTIVQTLKQAAKVACVVMIALVV